MLRSSKTSVQEDEQDLARTSTWEHKMAILFRLEQKRILVNQIQLVSFLLTLVCQTDPSSAKSVALRPCEAENCQQDSYWVKRLYNSLYIKDLVNLPTNCEEALEGQTQRQDQVIEDFFAEMEEI